MSITVELNAGRCKKYDRATLARIACEVVLMSHKIEDIKNKKITVSIAIVSEEEIQRINREFRGKNKPTDVISIGDYSDDRDISSEENREIFLGEIILCYNYIVQIAHAHDTSIDDEFYAVYVHGLLHLLGFDHGKKMFALQDRICANLR